MALAQLPIDMHSSLGSHLVEWLPQFFRMLQNRNVLDGVFIRRSEVQYIGAGPEWCFYNPIELQSVTMRVYRLAFTTSPSALVILCCVGCGALDDFLFACFEFVILKPFSLLLDFLYHLNSLFCIICFESFQERWAINVAIQCK